MGEQLHGLPAAPGWRPAQALAEAGEELAGRLRSLADEYFAQRADDLAAVSARILDTPSAALVARHLPAQADLFSVGTNDLTQYVTGADRGGSALIAATVEAAAPQDVPVAVCDEAAADPASAAVVLGLGVKELSVAPALVERTRRLVGELDDSLCVPAARQALEPPDAAVVRELFAPLLP